MIGNIAEPLITLVAFGYGLGALVGTVQGLPYIQFLASGSVATSAAIAATFGRFRLLAHGGAEDLGQHHERPVALDDIVFAEMLWAATKSVFSVGAIPS